MISIYFILKYFVSLGWQLLCFLSLVYLYNYLAHCLNTTLHIQRNLICIRSDEYSFYFSQENYCVRISRTWAGTQY